MALFSGPGYVRVNGNTVTLSTQIKIDLATNNQGVDTMLEGYAGHSKGSKVYTVEVENPVPAEGFEVDWLGIAEAQEEVDVDFVLPGVVDFGFQGEIDSAGLETATNKAANATMKFTGKRTR